MLKGNSAPNATIPPAVKKFHVNTDSIVNSKCPAVILAANLSPRDSAFAKCEMNSIMTKNGAIPKGAPAGINIEK